MMHAWAQGHDIYHFLHFRFGLLTNFFSTRKWRQIRSSYANNGNGDHGRNAHNLWVDYGAGGGGGGVL